MGEPQAIASISRVLADVFDDFLLAVEGKTIHPVLIFGPKDEEANIAPPAVWWDFDGDEKWASQQVARAGGPGNPRALKVREIPIGCLIFGGEGDTSQEADFPSTDLYSTQLTEWLMLELVNALQRRLTLFGYDVTSCSWGRASRTELGMACELRITIRLPVIATDNGTTIPMKPVAAKVEVNDGR